MSNISVESVCVFGSAARNTTDSFSDRDILVVSDNLDRRFELEKYWSSKGWSVALYSPSQLKGMIRHGSLFIQHLKREGMLLRDKSGWLKQLLNDAAPRKSYESDLARSVDMIRPMERLVEGNWSSLLAADLAFVFFRNFGIYSLAESRVYEFDYHRIIDHLIHENDLEADEGDLLHELRAMKVAYRERQRSVVENPNIDGLLHICKKVVKVSCFDRVPGSSPIRVFPLRYATLRDAEAKLVTSFDVHDLDRAKFGKEISDAWGMIQAPRDYSWNLRRVDETWAKVVDQGIRNYSHRAPVYEARTAFIDQERSSM